MNDNMQGNNQNAVSLYQGQDGPVEDFPVLKAFQQYIDAEQAKARKRLVGLGIFFGVLTGAVIAVFVVLLINMSHRNQMLNDRLVDFVIKDRDRPPVVVQQPQNQDNTAIIALTAKMGEIQQKLIENQQKAEDAERVRKAEEAERAKKAEEAERARRAEEAERARRAEEAEKLRKANEEIAKARKAAEEAEKARQAALAPKLPTPQEIEIAKLKALLAAEVERNKQNAQTEKDKAEAEKKRKREEELEAYRRKHYPELYADEEDDDVPVVRTKRRKSKVSRPQPKVRYEIEDEPDDDDLDDVLDTVDSVLKDRKSRPYSDGGEQQVDPKLKRGPAATPATNVATTPAPSAKVQTKVAASAALSVTNAVSKPVVQPTPSPSVSNSVTNAVSKPVVQPTPSPSVSNSVTNAPASVKAAQSATPQPKVVPASDEYVIPVDIKGKASSWRIP